MMKKIVVECKDGLSHIKFFIHQGFIPLKIKWPCGMRAEYYKCSAGGFTYYKEI